MIHKEKHTHMVAGVCSGAVIRKGGVHHLKPDTVCLMERARERECVCVCECVTESERGEREKREIEFTVKIVEICITSSTNWWLCSVQLKAF